MRHKVFFFFKKKQNCGLTIEMVIISNALPQKANKATTCKPITLKYKMMLKLNHVNCVNCKIIPL